jgi:DNA-binding transcriptional MerR regulator
MADEHLSIGEVLSLLQDEFPDVTISKIRFLESQGLIDPERTPSGYRKFYEPDIERLRWILTQQRENFLPLKVIRERLGSVDGDATLFEDDDAERTDESSTDTSTEGSTEADLATVLHGSANDANRAEAGAALGGPTGGGAGASTAVDVVDPAADTSSSAPTDDVDGLPAPEGTGADAAASPGDDPEGETDEPQPIWMADLAASKGAKTLRAAAALPLDAGPTEVSLTRSELLSASGISGESLAQLEQYGLVAGRSYGDDVYFDGDALLIATRSAAFFQHGIEARHLRMFKVSAEREAGFLEQVAMPMLKQRNPEARRQAIEMVEELADLGHDLRAALLRANLRRHLDRS